MAEPTQYITPSECEKAARRAVAVFSERRRWRDYSYIYAIPRSGYSALSSFWRAMPEFFTSEVALLDEYLPEFASKTIVIDDVYDSGRTAQRYIDAGSLVMVLYGSDAAQFNFGVHVGHALPPSTYVVFPWEGKTSAGPEDAVRRLLQFLGRDPDDPAVLDTPRRVLAWLAEFREDKEPITATTFDGVDYDGMVIVRDVPFVSMCEHHLLPFTGTAALGYIPENGRVLGLSKMARILHQHARRSQVQERLTKEVHDALQLASASTSVAVVLRAEHLCMSLRGPAVPGHTTITSEISGSFRDAEPRAEFMSIIHAHFDK